MLKLIVRVEDEEDGGSFEASVKFSDFLEHPNPPKTLFNLVKEAAKFCLEDESADGQVVNKTLSL